MRDRAYRDVIKSCYSPSEQCSGSIDVVQPTDCSRWVVLVPEGHNNAKDNRDIRTKHLCLEVYCRSKFVKVRHILISASDKF